MRITVPPKGIVTLIRYYKGDINFFKAPTNSSMEMGYETFQFVWTVEILTTVHFCYLTKSVI